MSALTAHPMFRATDPQSSRQAAEDMERMGHAARQRDEVILAVRRHPGKTSAELAAIAGLDRFMAARRLPEAEREGRAKRGTARKCAQTQRLSITWWPAGGEAGDAA